MLPDMPLRQEGDKVQSPILVLVAADEKLAVDNLDFDKR
jgi:hypothetical protein